tara:strand:+ start:310 stop:417 length:108 start_codon:yes stop_codon:yes gene_type:complete
MFLLNLIARLLYGSEALEEMDKKPKQKPKQKRKRK